MLAFPGKRSAKAQRMIDFISSKEWGLMILDEVQTVPAEMVRHHITSHHITSHFAVPPSADQGAGQVQAWIDGDTCARGRPYCGVMMQ